MEFSARYESYRQMVEKGLEEYLPAMQLAQAKLLDAMRYSVFPGGKRLRPVLTLAFCEAAGGQAALALPFACALEMIHTYSLIHDDLPCMDNDAMRRGRPSNHRVFGEASAVLAGDALLTAAFETMLDADYIEGVPLDVALRAAHRVAWASGLYGMAGGQLLDLESDTLGHSVDGVLQTYLFKTVALFEAAAAVGCIAAQAGEEAIAAASSFARCCGLAFQIRDDLLDAAEDEAVRGTMTESGAVRAKLTLTSMLGEAESLRLIDSLNTEAASYLKPFENDPFLLALAQTMANHSE